MKYFFLLLCLSSISACSALQKAAEFINARSYQGSSNDVSVSLHKIDRAKTYELFILFEKPEERIKIDFSATQVGSDEQEEKPQVFFTLEKRYKKPVPGNGEQELYLLIGKNYDSSWSVTQESYFTTKPSEPLLSLDAGLYRTRFTIFNDKPFDFSLTVFSHSAAAHIAADPAELLQYGAEPKGDEEQETDDETKEQ